MKGYVLLVMLWLLWLLFPAPCAAAMAVEAREAFRLYQEGQRRFHDNKIGEALDAFQQSAALHFTPLTSYNIGNCELILGHRTRARLAFDRALKENPHFHPPATLERAELQRARELLGEINRQMAVVEVTLDPPDAAIAIDGSPLYLARSDEGPEMLVAGVLPPGPAQRPPRATFVLLIEAVAHRLTLSRKGWKDVDVYRPFLPTDLLRGPPRLKLQLDLLPARLSITASQPAAIVSIDGDDVGPCPAHVERPAGRHVVTVKKPGYLPFESPISVQAGEEATLRANLLLYRPPFYKKWWFWSGAALLAGGIVGLTLGLTYGLRDDRPLVVFGQ